MPGFPALGMTTSKRVGSSGNLPCMVPSQLPLVSRSIACTILGGEAQAFVGFGPSMSMASALTEQGTSHVPLNSLSSCMSTQVRMLVSDCAMAEQANRDGMNVAPIAKATATRRNRCCVPAATGNAAAPPSTPRNSRLMSAPSLGRQHLIGLSDCFIGVETGFATATSDASRCPLWVQNRKRSAPKDLRCQLELQRALRARRLVSQLPNPPSPCAR